MGEDRKLTPEDIARFSPWEVEQLARAQLSSTRYGAESDAMTALHLIIALARRVQRLEEPLS